MGATSRDYLHVMWRSRRAPELTPASFALLFTVLEQHEGSPFMHLTPRMSAPPPPPSRLLGVPGELRNRIYRYVSITARSVRQFPDVDHRSCCKNRQSS